MNKKSLISNSSSDHKIEEVKSCYCISATVETLQSVKFLHLYFLIYAIKVRVIYGEILAYQISFGREVSSRLLDRSTNLNTKNVIKVQNIQDLEENLIFWHFASWRLFAPLHLFVQ